jgi:hypothetical protein
LLVKNLDQINVALPLANRDYEGDIQGVGSTVHVRTLGSVTMGSWTTNGTISYQDLAPTAETLVISDAQYFAVKVDDVDAAQNDIAALAKYARRAAVAVNNKVDAKIQGVYASALTANKITGASSAAITLDSSSTALTGIYPVMVEAGVRLDVQNAPTEGRFFIVDPATYALLLNDTTHFIRSTELGDRMVQQGTIADGGRPGFVGQCAGFSIYKSNAVPSASGAKYLLYGVEGAISYAAQIKSVEMIRLETTFATALRGLLLHGAGVFAEASKMLGHVKATA